MIEFLQNNPQIVVTLLIGVFTFILSFWYNRRNLKINKHKLERELFTEFNKRYDELNDSLSLLTDTMTIDDLKNNLLKIENKTLYNVVIDYFNLCAEQYYWKNKKRISKEIWEAWHAGMMYYYNTYPVVRELWKEETKEEGFKSYYLKDRTSFFE